jgi:hypothetical protein
MSETTTPESRTEAAGPVDPLVRICSTDEFWSAMCSFSFVRVDLCTGFNGRTKTKYITKTPPEHVDGFLEKKIQETQSLLCPKQNAIQRLLAKLFGFYK